MLPTYVLWDPATSKQVYCDQKLQFKKPARRAGIKGEDSVVLSSIIFPCDTDKRGRLICNLNMEGTKSWESYYPEVFGLIFKAVV